ncbi:hypothetical protein [Falsihalocynthiibacter sp. CO-5D18]|uniref:hypothetical protein n=1 Tax=Falsihalocynthiibacter sp. CO-5D18 TaxID=3240872 RepID=UPI003510AB94
MKNFVGETMLGWKMFTHSIGMVFSDFKASLQISGVLYAAVLAAQYFLLKPLVEMAEVGGELTAPVLLSSLAGIIISIVAGLWIAVSWHRYVLLGENSGGVLPPFEGRVVLSYFWRGILIGLVGFVVMFIIGFIVGAIMYVLRPLLTSLGLNAEMILIFLLYIPAFAVFYRLSPVLPAVALGKSMSLREAWNATSELRGAILTLAFIVFAVSVALYWLTGLLFPTGLISMIIQNGVIGWISTMVGVSILTTIYGMAIEGRELP